MHTQTWQKELRLPNQVCAPKHGCWWEGELYVCASYVFNSAGGPKGATKNLGLPPACEDYRALLF